MTLKIFSISFLIALLVSCDSHKYIINWHTFNVSSDSFITISFRDNDNYEKYKFHLIPNQTNNITVPNGARFIGEEMPIDIRLAVYPSFNELPNGGNLEFFVFNPIVEQIDNNEFKMQRQEGVEAYFIKFSKNGKRYYAISKDEVIFIHKEIIPNSFDNNKQLLDMILIEDITYFDEAGTSNYNGSELLWGGYIVKTTNDYNYLWLNVAIPIP